MENNIPIEGEKHYAATVYVVSEEEPKKVLLVYHKKFNKWMPPGGHQENFENHCEAAIREVLEETGIDIVKHLPSASKVDNRAFSLPLPQYIFEEKIDSHGDQPEHYHLDMIHVVKVPSQKVKHSESESHDIKWFEYKDLASIDLFDNVRNVLNKIFDESN